ncbi:MAG: polysaccharide pyruvyl transferase family protein [Planctomycetota bacterium]
MSDARVDGAETEHLCQECGRDEACKGEKPDAPACPERAAGGALQSLPLSPFQADAGANITETVRKHLCNACGACAGVCPEGAISLREGPLGHLIPKVDGSKCAHCGMCLRVCQGANFLRQMSPGLPHDPFHGRIAGSFVGRATDRRVYLHSQSGGLATALSLCALEEEDVEGVVVVSMPPGNPPRPTVRIARTPAEVRNAQKSKYCPVPLLQALRRIEDVPGKVVVVGLPCHMHGLANVVAELPRYEHRIKYRVGLICDRMMTYAALDYLMVKAGTGACQEIEFTYRDKLATGFPGDVKVCGEKTVILPAELRMAAKDMFTPIRCRLCFDKMNVLSDVTLGDPHGIDDHGFQVGASVVLVRTDAGQSLVDRALRQKRVALQAIPAERILTGQKIDSEKVGAWSGFVRAWSEMGYELPAALSGLPVKSVATENYKAQLEAALALKRTGDREEIFRLAEKRFARFRPTSRRKRSKTTTVEIKGVSFVNKGAELMLHSILQHYEGGGRMRFAMEPRGRLARYRDRARLGLFQKLTINGERVPFHSAELCELYGLVPDEEVDVVLDASGFCYSDQFGTAKSERMAQSVQRWRRQGTTVILLPQAFGPFENERIRTAATIIVENADLVFARDEASLEHLRSLGTSMQNVSRAPDFTCLTEGVVPEPFRARHHLFCVIPNIKIFEQLPRRASAAYIPLLKQCIELARRRGLSPFILVHQTGGDRDIALALQREVDGEIEIVMERHPLRVKGIIGQCEAVISSRYHGLINAVSQGVPSLGTGWSHKYEMLFREYGCPECLIALQEDGPGEREEKMERVFCPEQRAALRAILLTRSENQRKQVMRMWEKVDAVVSRSGDGGGAGPQEGAKPPPGRRKPSRATRLRQAEACHACGNNRQALRLLSELLEQYPEDPEVQNDIGVVLHSQGRSEESINHLMSAYRLDPQRSDTRANLERLLRDTRVGEAQRLRIKNLLRHAERARTQ